MKLPRCRVRTMMVVVAVAGLGVFGVQMARRRTALSARAATCAQAQKVDKIWKEKYRRRLADCSPGAEPNVHDLRRYSLFSRRLAHYTALKAKYEHCARYPWLPVAPDPPEPK